MIALFVAAMAAWRRWAGRNREPARLSPAARAPRAGALPEPPPEPPRQPGTTPLPWSDGPHAEVHATPTAPSPPPPETDAVAGETGETGEAGDQTVETERARPAAPDRPAPRFVSVPWTLAIDEAQARDRTEIPITYTLLGDRMELDRIDVRETASQVFVTVLAQWSPPDGGRVLYGVAREGTLRLERPLGDRAVVHAPDDLADLQSA
jgi:hypothetical protein